MKLQGITGKGSGKLGSSVWVVRKGQQIVREYVAQVNNPKSESQAQQRAKFKLMSQISALMAPVVVNRPVGSESVRNAFTRENSPKFTWDSTNSRAVVDMLDLALTSSALGLPNLSPMTAAPTLTVSLDDSPVEAVDAVMYVAVAKTGDKYGLVFHGVVDTPGGTGHFPGAIRWPSATTHGFVYAYGIKWTSEDVRTLYESYKSDPNHSASLILQLLKTPSNAVFTVTRVAEVTVSE